MPGWILLAGGPDVGEDGLDEIVLWEPEGEEEVVRDSVSSEEQEGPGPSP